jgi:hypothetical protein
LTETEIGLVTGECKSKLCQTNSNTVFTIIVMVWNYIIGTNVFHCDVSFATVPYIVRLSDCFEHAGYILIISDVGTT